MKKQLWTGLLLSLIIITGCNTNENENTDAKDTMKHQAEIINVSDSINNLKRLETGQGFAQKTQKVLGKNLLNAIKTKGTEHAVSFCKDEAYPLTDSMALVLNAQIKRVTDKARNPENIATGEELDYILKSKGLIAKGENVKPEIKDMNGKSIAYYPIMTNQMCMQCHGKTNTEVLSNTLSKIKTLYPNDKAVGYKVNELRGIWVVEMNKK